MDGEREPHALKLPTLFDGVDIVIVVRRLEKQTFPRFTIRIGTPSMEYGMLLKKENTRLASEGKAKRFLRGS